MPDSAAPDFLDQAEYKIRRYRIENAFVKSPIGLAVCSMIPLALFCFVIGRSDVAAIASTLILGGGVFLYALGNTLEKLTALRKELQRAELTKLNGGFSHSSSSPLFDHGTTGGGVWKVMMPGLGETHVRADRRDGGQFLVNVDGRLFFDYWASSAIQHTRRLPKLRSEVRKTAAFRAAMHTHIGNGSSPIPAPQIKVTHARGIYILSGRDDLGFFLANHANSFPVVVDTIETAMDLHTKAGVDLEPIDLAELGP